MKIIFALIIPLPLAAGGGALNRDNGLMLFLFILAVLLLVAGINLLIENRSRILNRIMRLFHHENKKSSSPVE
jgi:hypothetical protein